ncbi:hypothetical protein MPLDJ20_280030 [Mesorhizobium plurifarium]|uniref:Uncharacterized protein n=1 Tax=Mesorhizobium plurifarium TaxID=69974 RepID=A0A090F9K4_MESPL|nr:hypothetical protein MPLDJ20_280030 [Mesorhizobium plurifarium]
MLGDRLSGNAARLVLAVDLERHATLEEQQRTGRQHRKLRHAFDHEIGADPLRLDLLEPHALGDDGKLVRRDKRQLPLVAHLGAARIPRLAPARAPRRSAMEVTCDTVEAKLQFRDRPCLEMIVRSGIERRCLGRQLAAGHDVDRRFRYGEKFQVRFLHAAGLKVPKNAVQSKALMIRSHRLMAITIFLPQIRFIGRGKPQCCRAGRIDDRARNREEARSCRLDTPSRRFGCSGWYPGCLPQPGQIPQKSAPT